MAGNLRAAQKESTRRLFLTTALRLFTEKGYAATTIDDIVEAAGTARVTFYAHFPSRSDLMRTLVDELNSFRFDPADTPGERSHRRSLITVVSEGDAEAMAGWLRMIASRWDDIGPYLKAAHDAAIVDSELGTAVGVWLDEGRSDVVEGLGLAGRFDAATRRARADLALALLDHVARNWTDARWDTDREHALQVLIETWVSLLGIPQGPAQD
ncbi:helix-turn-helix domain-containing protein [Streptomyces sp. NPDC052052]|uniref:TetR/AcrR family transcriptional regulator n=1 Tax=Streptomyces sp. NPDC052052 TaxID=3154756 RepID=UPI003426EC3C